MRWQERYSSAEMIYVEVTDKEVLSYLHGYEHKADRWTFEEVLEGKADYEVGSIFADTVLEEVKAAVRERLAGR